jgi:protein associated with RNAse G/E
VDTKSTQPFLEIKRSLTGEERVYECELVRRSSRLVIVRFVFAQPLTAGGITFPTGGVTLGFFWRDRHYNLYHMLTPDGQRIADRFDVIDAAHFQPGGVRYDDLLLDVWLHHDGRIAVEDEGEVQEAVACGRLSPRQQATIERTKRLLTRRAPAIVEAALARVRTHYWPASG